VRVHLTRLNGINSQAFISRQLVASTVLDTDSNLAPLAPFVANINLQIIKVAGCYC
jgi:hypothetical protein